LGDTEGVEAFSPGLPDSERATPGRQSVKLIHFGAKRGERSEYLLLSVQAARSILQCTLLHSLMEML
jgi:hypothetical protein